MYALPLALAPFSRYDQFILWRAVPHPTLPHKVIKKPVDFRTMWTGDAHDQGSWTNIHAAAAMAESAPDLGVGFVFTPADPFFFLDIDSAFDGANWSQHANELCTQFAGAACEVSVSGTGLHIFGTGICPEHSCKNTALNLELYTELRSMALGKPETAVGDAGLDCSAALPSLVSTYFMPGSDADAPAEWTNIPREDWRGPDDDKQLIERMLNSKSAAAVFGGKASPRDLWENNIEALSRAYPAEGRPYDGSSADAALCSHLAFWTGCNCERMLGLMKQSALVREKWTKHRDYLKISITSAVGFQRDVYKQRAIDTQEITEGTEAGNRYGAQFMFVDQQVEFFKDCHWIADQDKVLMPNGLKLRPHQFKTKMSKYLFQMDSGNEETCKNAFEVLTNSLAYNFENGDSGCFKPLDERRVIKDINAKRVYINEYVDPNVERVQGDVTLFLDHLEILLPDENDRAIMMAYMAAIVQHKGVKFQWAPMLQGVQGNGKTLFTRCLQFAVGKIHTHMLDAADMSNKFNAWMHAKIFIGVEDINLCDDHGTVHERLKPMITNEDQPIQAKGVDQLTMDICCNFVFNSNHRGAIRVSDDERRFCVFYTAQQEKKHLYRDGLTAGYFKKLYGWLKNNDGYAMVAEYLHTYAIPDALNPAVDCTRAPATTSIAEVLEQSLGMAEHEILEAIGAGVEGFNGGFISSFAVERLFSRMRRLSGLGSQKRAEIIRGMHYIKHPGLPGGRVGSPIALDNGRTTLYIHEDNTVLSQLIGPAVIVHFEQAQREAKNFGDQSKGLIPGEAPPS